MGIEPTTTIMAKRNWIDNMASKALKEIQFSIFWSVIEIVSKSKLIKTKRKDKFAFYINVTIHIPFSSLKNYFWVTGSLRYVWGSTYTLGIVLT